MEEVWSKEDEEAVGTVSLVYDHHTRDLAEKYEIEIIPINFFAEG